MNNIPNGLKNLLIIMALVALAQVALPKIGFNIEQLYLFYPDSSMFRVWQIFTHVFCHGGIGHLLFNGIALFSFGAIVEMRLGSSKFLQLFFISALGAVFVHFGQMAYLLVSQTGLMFPNHVAGYEAIPYGPMIGASGAVYGVMTAFAMLYPNEKLVFLFVPYPIKAKFLVPGMVVLDLVLGLSSVDGDNIAHFAHIGGALTGVMLILIWRKQLDSYKY